MSGFSLFSRDDDSHGNFGEGISRAVPDPTNKPFKVRVVFRGSLPMFFTQDAPSMDAAIKYAQNRWPEAMIEPMP